MKAESPPVPVVYTVLGWVHGRDKDPCPSSPAGCTPEPQAVGKHMNY